MVKKLHTFSALKVIMNSVASWINGKSSDIWSSYCMGRKILYSRFYSDCQNLCNGQLLTMRGMEIKCWPQAFKIILKSSKQTLI